MTLPSLRTVLAFLWAIGCSSGAWSNPSGTATDPPAQVSALAAQRSLDAPVHQAQVEARILWAPRVVPGSDGRRHVAYELRITSSQDGDVTVVQRTVLLDPAAGR